MVLQVLEKSWNSFVSESVGTPVNFKKKQKKILHQYFEGPIIFLGLEVLGMDGKWKHREFLHPKMVALTVC